MMGPKELARRGNMIRRDIIEMIYRAGDGHPAPSLSAADIVACLYFGKMNIDPSHPNWEDRDRFVLSKGHACPALYAALGLKGYFSRLTGDGELGEGINWEAAQTAVKYRLDNLTLIVDNNGMQSGGSVEEVGGIVNIPGKFASFGFEVIEVDGHDTADIMNALNKAAAERPKCIVAHTVKGKGVSFMEHNNAWHKGVPNDEQYRIACAELEALIDG